MRGDGVEQLLGNAIGISVEEANPLFLRRFDGGETGEQNREPVFYAQVFAEAGGVLADEVDFADALREQPRGLCDHGFKAPAAECSAVLRNDTKRAGMVAALGNLEVREVVGRRQDARREVVIVR